MKGRRVKHGTHPRASDLVRTARLFRRFMGSRRPYVVGMVLLAIEAGTAVVEPWPIAYLIDFLQGAKPGLQQMGAPAFLASARVETILLLTLAIVLIVAINSATDSFAEVCMARGGRSLGYSIRVAMYSLLQRLSLAYHDKRRTGDVLTRVTGDVLVVEDFVVQSVSNIVGSFLVLVGSFVFLLTKSWNVAMVALVVVPLLAVVSNHFSHRIKVASKTQRDREGELASTAQEMLTSIRLVQSYGRGTVDLERFSRQTEESMHASVGTANIQAQFGFVIAMVEALSISAVIWLGVWLVDRNAITIGTLVLFVLLLQNMFKPARKIVSEWYKVGKVFASVERIQDLLDREVVVEDLPGARPAPRLQGRLSFRNVSFTYPVEHEDGSRGERRPQVLNDIDFDVAPGEVVGLIGFSGAGKSTIAQLVPRLYDPDQGEVLVDGLPVRSLTLASLRSQISVVLQETVLLSGTVAENIGYGIADATQDDIEAAARMANAHDFIVALPDGYRTQLGERAATLSGGQRQRIAIARAFIRRAPILILDEPTTGLDHESARSVVVALRSLMQGTSTIVISHDPGLIECADRVLVISGGQIVERGRHDAGPAAPETSSLLDGMGRQLPDLARALDPEAVTVGLERALLDPGVRAAEVAAEKLWLRRDGTCGVRYRLHLSGPDLSTDDSAVVLGRVHRGGGAAEASVASYLSSGTRGVHGRRAAVPPWRAWVGAAPEAALALYRFPLDPDLPTLADAVDPAVLGRLGPFLGEARPPDVAVVHHPREGACVLRYRTSPDAAGPTLYGKVYGNGRGDVVDGFLRALAREHDHHDIHLLVRFPKPVLYHPALRLLLTESLTGEPLVPRLVKAVVRGPDRPHAVQEAQLRSAVRDTGRALAALHGSDLATAPVHPGHQELTLLRADLELVGRFWPQVAERLGGRVDTLAAEVPPAPDMVLSHGDFTPSQVLLDGRGPAVVDLDTLCWADPALDLGRYLAHLELAASRAGGQAARPLIETLTQELLGGYGEVTPRTARAAASVDRIGFYKATTLARTALHSCRQLKDHRLELAESLLARAHPGRIEL